MKPVDPLYDALLATIAEHTGLTREQVHDVLLLEQDFWAVPAHRAEWMTRQEDE